MKWSTAVAARRFSWLLVVLGLVQASPPAIAAANGTDVDLALVLLVDISGSMDSQEQQVQRYGPSNNGPYVLPTREQVLKKKITINGLPITLRVDAGQIIPGADIEDLEQYYRDCVIGGPNAFLFVVNRLVDFPVAIRRKLIQ